MARKPTAKEKEARIHDASLKLCSGQRASEVRKYLQETYGVSYDTACRYIKEARCTIRDDFSSERCDFLASRLAILERVIAVGLESNQLGSVVGAVRLAMEATGSMASDRSK